LAACGYDLPDIALFFVDSPTPNLNIQSMDILLEMGNPSVLPNTLYVSQVGWEQILVVVNKDNPISRLSTGEIQAIFSGQAPSWENGSGTPIQVWIFPSEDPIRTLFDSLVMKSERITSQAMLAPDLQAMLEAVAADANSMGYLPESYLIDADIYLVGKVKTLQLDQTLQDDLHQPIIVLTMGEPQGVMRDLLVCLQGNNH
jgi:phosphate transport system substrate-binding protein